MPAARNHTSARMTASGPPPRRQQLPFPTSSPSPSRRRTHAAENDLDVINLTDNENTEVQNKPQPRPRPKKSSFVPRPEDIIEISSDDENSAPPPPVKASIIADYRRQLAKNREENVKHKRDYERVAKELTVLRQENERLKALHKPETNKVILETSKISDLLDCEICTCRMWTPYILPGCGHSFCQSCLQDWFTTTKTQFFATHPPFTNVNYGFMEIMRQIEMNPHVVALPYIQAFISNEMPACPKYTCPTCRAPVTIRPTEAFSQKALVRSIAAAAGEVIPKSVQQKGEGMGVIPGPWDAFFLPKKT